MDNKREFYTRLLLKSPFKPHLKIMKWAFAGFLGSMIVNAFFPHLIATILMTTYAPGLATALLLNVPVNTVILYKLQKQNLIRVKEIVMSTVVVGIFLIGLIPLLFPLGGILINLENSL